MMPLTRLMFRPCSCCFVTKNHNKIDRRIMRSHKRQAKRRELRLLTRLIQSEA